MDDRAMYEFEGFRLDPGRRQLARTDGEPVDVRAKAFDALVYLVEHSGELVSRAALTKAVWPKAVVEDNSLNKVMVAVRQAVGESCIVTVPGRGYQFIAEVRRQSPPQGSLEEPASERPIEPRSLPVTTRLIFGVLAIVAAIVSGYLLWSADDGADVRAPGTLSSIVPLTTQPGHAILPTLSPDGQDVAFAWQLDDGNRDIYRLSIRTGKPVRLTTDPEQDRDPAWSPDGGSIAFLRMIGPNDANVVVLSLATGQERTLGTIRFRFVGMEYTGRRIAWTPDSRRLLVTSQIADEGNFASGFAFHLLSVDTGTMEPLRLRGTGYDTSPAFSGDGKLLAFTRYLHEHSDGVLMVQELGNTTPVGEPRIIAAAREGTARSPSWSPDGSRLVFVSGTQILEWARDGALRPLSTPGDHLWLGLAVDWNASPIRAVAGRRTYDANLWWQPLDRATYASTGAAERRSPSSAHERHPRYSPDGARIAFVSNRTGSDELWLVDADGRRTQRLTEMRARDIGAPSWSPDGQRIAFAASLPAQEPIVHVIDLDSGVPTNFAAGITPSWSADGLYLYVTDVRTGEVMRIRVSDRMRQWSFPGSGAVETRDGRWVLYGENNQVGLFARPLDGGVLVGIPQQLVDDLAPRGSFHVMQDGVYYVANELDGTAAEFRYYDFTERTARTVAPAPPFTPSVRVSLTISPDGNQLVYSASTSGIGGDLVLLDLGGPPAMPIDQ
jgi:Tol biopolymer transport system component/DNA-binding winged helix-turn-helix (wHTH) protein